VIRSQKGRSGVYPCKLCDLLGRGRGIAVHSAPNTNSSLSLSPSALLRISFILSDTIQAIDTFPSTDLTIRSTTEDNPIAKMAYNLPGEMKALR
jgi:hypothetical protein